MMDLLRKVVESIDCSYADARYQARDMTDIAIEKGEIDEVSSLKISGVGIRVLKSGAWGFSGTNSTEVEKLASAAKKAERMAVLASEKRGEKVKGLADADMAEGRYEMVPKQPLEDIAIEDKMSTVVEAEKEIRGFSDEIVSARCSYNEIIDRKIFVNTDGNWFESYLSKPEFRTIAVCKAGGEAVIGIRNIGVTGGWKDLFSKMDHLEIAEQAASKAVRLLKASHPKGGRSTVVLDPSLAGIISHEAIGHTVEADFVRSGSIASGLMGKKVASELVTIADSGKSEYVSGAAGTLMVDDEGVLTRRVEIIREGVLVGYLHDRESAAYFNEEPTGNAKAFEYNNEPLIRMRNTYVEPGDWTLEELIQDTKRGYLMKGAMNGEADSNATFMFAIQEAQEIVNGELGKTYRGVSVSGNALEVLSKVDAVTKEFEWDLGSGYCGKGQWAKVDGGGGYLRCEALMGGR